MQSLEGKRAWERRYRVLPIYRNLQEAQRCSEYYKGNNKPIPCWALLELPNVMNCVLFHHNDTIFMCDKNGNPGGVDIKVLSFHGSKRIAEAFAKSYDEAPERILLRE
jgi:hypothetical protein